jgi:CP family cyanate transporter-like MFS transporter
LWKIALAFGTVNAMYFSSNAFLPDYLTALGRADLISEALTALNAGQLPASFLMLAFAGRLLGRAWPFAATGAGALASVIGIVTLSGWWIVFCAAVLGFCCAGVLVLALALPPLVFKAEDVARMSAAVFTISYGCAVIVPVLAGLAWDLSGLPALAFLPIGLCAVALMALTPRFRFRDRRA